MSKALGLIFPLCALTCVMLFAGVVAFLTGVGIRLYGAPFTVGVLLASALILSLDVAGDIVLTILKAWRAM